MRLRGASSSAAAAVALALRLPCPSHRPQAANQMFCRLYFSDKSRLHPTPRRLHPTRLLAGSGLLNLEFLHLPILATLVLPLPR
jgi:hypothetical protein